MGVRLIRLDPRQGSVITGPEVEGGAQIKDIEPSKFYQTIGLPIKTAGDVPPPLQYLESEKIKNLENLSEDLILAARNALMKMIAYLQREHGLTSEQAYILACIEDVATVASELWGAIDNFRGGLLHRDDRFVRVCLNSFHQCRNLFGCC